jgi:pyridoxine 5'-phosphate synthase PdxJ
LADLRQPLWEAKRLVSGGHRHTEEQAVHDKMMVKAELTVELEGHEPSDVALPSVEQFEDAFRRLEIAELFQAAEEMGLDRLAGHVLADANLDYVTDKPFDRTDQEPAGDEPF